MRRALGFLSMLLMLHLTLVGSDSVCAKHSFDAAVGVVGGHSAHAGMHGDQHHPAQSHGEQTEPCQTPVSQDCCKALTSCSPTIEVAPATSVRNFYYARADRPKSPPSSRLTRVPAPEPPPPKA